MFKERQQESSTGGHRGPWPFLPARSFGIISSAVKAGEKATAAEHKDFCCHGTPAAIEIVEMSDVFADAVVVERRTS